jgi:predicted acyltransferase
MTAHAVWRSLVLVFLGVFLRSVGRDRTNFTFEDTLSQIGLGYTFLFLLALRPARDQWIAFVLLVVGYWGLFAGGVLRREWPAGKKFLWFVVAGVLTLALGWGAGELGICPVVKRIWTPSWVLFSGGICFLFLAAFYAIIDGIGWGGWSFPLRVIGMNSIAAYVLSHLIDGFIKDSFRTHLGRDAFAFLGQEYAPFVQGAAVLLVLWLILFWMYRRKLFLKI